MTMRIAPFILAATSAFLIQSATAEEADKAAGAVKHEGVMTEELSKEVPQMTDETKSGTSDQAKSKDGHSGVMTEEMSKEVPTMTSDEKVQVK